MIKNSVKRILNIDAISTELRLMFKAFNRIPNGVEPMIERLDQHIVEEGKKAMHASKEIITNVSFHYFQAVPTIHDMHITGDLRIEFNSII